MTAVQLQRSSFFLSSPKLFPWLFSIHPWYRNALMDGPTVYYSHQCINNRQPICIVTMYILHRISSLLRLHLYSICCICPGKLRVSSLKQRQSWIQPLKICYITAAEHFTCFRNKVLLQVTTSYLFWCWKCSYILSSARKTSPAPEKLASNQALILPRTISLC